MLTVPTTLLSPLAWWALVFDVQMFSGFAQVTDALSPVTLHCFQIILLPLKQGASSDTIFLLTVLIIFTFQLQFSVVENS